MNQKNEKSLVSAKNKNGKTFSIPTKQRALVLQGGGALGYYEIGVLKSICDHLFANSKPSDENDQAEDLKKMNALKQNHDDQRNKTNGDITNEHAGDQFFDIIAGVSIGAINAVFLVDYVLKNNGRSEGAYVKLKDFWDNFKAYTYAESNPWFGIMWNSLRLFNGGLASTEAARRYWSFYELACLPPPFGGVSPNLCNSSMRFDTKYFSPLNNFLSYDYKPLMKMMEKSINYPIKTDFEQNQPRLLLLSVDVKDCSTAVTFDSYRNYKSVCDVCGQDLKQNKLLAKHIIGHVREISNAAQGIDCDIISKSIPSADRNEDSSNNSEDYIWTSIYGDENNDVRRHVVSYNGIDNDILMASCLFPYSNHHTRLYDLVSREQRTFWDGAFLSNTPLRELLQKHKDFWISYFKANDIEYDNIGEQESGIYQDQSLGRSSGIPKIPDLEVFIINLYPAVETRDDSIPKDRDKIEDRMNDIRFHDRSRYDEKVAHLVTDYVDLARRLIKLAKETGKVSDEQLKDVLGITGESTTRDVKRRRNFLSLVEDKFMVRVYRIDRQDDKDTIYGKASDFTPTTLENLYKEGVEDANQWFDDLYDKTNKI
ncbi:MAG TPA: patatin-like phospholipase family protein [Phototrophicaceae bacterium]|nr:patatin-like phospholipase family protein [Phototrophicaceae bacterium]